MYRKLYFRNLEKGIEKAKTKGDIVRIEKVKGNYSITVKIY